MSDTLKRLEILYELKKYEELLHVSVPLCTSSSKSESEAYMYTILALIALKRYHEAGVLPKCFGIISTHYLFSLFKRIN